MEGNFIKALTPLFNSDRTTIGTNYYGTKTVCNHFLPLIKEYGTLASSHILLKGRMHADDGFFEWKAEW